MRSVQMASDWEAYRYLLGEWEGENTGNPGQGRGSFTFTFDLDQNILVRRSSTAYPATAERPAFTHDDLIIIYTELTGNQRAIYFDNEGHVIHYEVSASADQKTISLVSDPNPTFPRFRFTYMETGVDTLDAGFEIAPPGQPEAFAMYISGPARRVKK
jgi:hypothetical protein